MDLYFLATIFVFMGKPNSYCCWIQEIRTR